MVTNSFEYINLYNVNPEKNYLLDPNNVGHNFFVAHPPQIINTDILKKNWLMKRDFFNQIDLFYRVNKSFAPNFDLSVFLKNIKTLKIRMMSQKLEIEIGAHAAYEAVGNIIYIKKDLFSLPHELYHLSTAINHGDFGFCGFSQINYSTGQTIGDQINDGYTSLLSKRYFNKKSCFPIPTAIMEIVENIVGKDLMENYFSKANLWGLLNELKNHRLYDLFIKIMNNLDSSFQYPAIEKGTESSEVLHKKQIFCYDRIQNVYETTIKLIVQDLKNKLIESKISRENAKEIFKDHLYNLISIFDKGWHEDEKKLFLSKDTTEKYLSEAFNEIDIMIKFN